MSQGNFDQAAASAAITALQDTVTLLQNQGPTRDRLARTALQEWSGPDATTFSTQRYPALKTHSTTLIQQLNGLITTISDASRAAAKAGAAPTGGGRVHAQ